MQKNKIFNCNKKNWYRYVFHRVNQVGILLKFDGKSDRQRDIRFT